MAAANLRSFYTFEILYPVLGNVSKIIFLRVLSGPLVHLSRFLNHNYEIDFSGKS